MTTSHDSRIPERPDPVRTHGLQAATAPGLQFASQLNGERRSNRIVAWLLLVAVLAPVLLIVLGWIRLF
ncbi:MULTISPECIES: hypothetical protein [Dermacoccus]|uniref:ABC transporter permease n=2 Tax=Dermacoccus TaxID=57495 RepID=A0A417ZBF4_9MICO|nr:hypothetical protein [Dermacoccus abyssi]RHW47978.1 hypothetical protein D1832_00595 [Dermacoccus abyssi]